MSLSRITGTIAAFAVGAAIILSADAQTLTAVPISAPITTTSGQPQPQILPAPGDDQLLTHQGPGTGINPGVVGVNNGLSTVGPAPVLFNPNDPNAGQLEPAFLNNPNILLQPQVQPLQPQGQPQAQPFPPQVQPLQPQVQPFQPQFQPQGQPQAQPFPPQGQPQLQPQGQPQIQPFQQPQVINDTVLVDPNPNNPNANPNLAIPTPPNNFDPNTAAANIANLNSIGVDQPTIPQFNPGNGQFQPAVQPNLQPGAQPNLQPAVQPNAPNFQPGVQPTPPNFQPNLQPGTQPNLQPNVPTLQPGAQPTVQPLPPNAGGVGDVNLSTPVITAPSVDPSTNTMFCPNHLKGCVVDGQVLCIDQKLLVCHENLLCPIEIPDVCVIKSSGAPQCYNKNVLICKDGELVPASDQ